ncbi:suppressor of fused domain protein [Hymenobacter sp. HD11105]
MSAACIAVISPTALMTTYQEALLTHYVGQWQTQPIRVHSKRPSFYQIGPDFCVLEFPPSAQRTMWTYATCGMSSFQMERALELHLFSPVQDITLVELLTAVAHYHQTQQPLDLGHTVHFGVPWQPGSACTYGLISLPYLDGPRLEQLRLEKQPVTCYWLLPITRAEREFKKTHGVEALEEAFEQQALDYLAPRRRSVV